MIMIQSFLSLYYSNNVFVDSGFPGKQWISTASSFLRHANYDSTFNFIYITTTKDAIQQAKPFPSSFHSHLYFLTCKRNGIKSISKRKGYAFVWRNHSPGKGDLHRGLSFDVHRDAMSVELWIVKRMNYDCQDSYIPRVDEHLLVLCTEENKLLTSDVFLRNKSSNYLCWYSVKKRINFNPLTKKRVTTTRPKAPFRHSAKSEKRWIYEACASDWAVFPLRERSCIW